MSDRDEMNLAALHDRRLHEAEIALAKQPADRVSGMRNIERWAISTPPTEMFEAEMRRVRRIHGSHAPTYKGEIEVVPASALEGAVSTLQRYGRHDDDCRSVRPGVGGACDCGFDAARVRVGGQS